MRFFVLTILFTASCGGEYQQYNHTDWTTRQGLEVQDDTGLVLQEDVEISLDIMQDQGDTDGRFWKKWRLVFTLDLIPCGYGDGECDGITRFQGETKEVIVQYRQSITCLSHTSLMHELTHVMQWQLDHVGDKEHSTSRYWGRSWGSMVAEAYYYAGKALCPVTK